MPTVSADITIANPYAYDTESPYGIVFAAYAVRGVPESPTVGLEITPTDAAFMLAGFINRWGLDNTRRAIDRLAQDDVEGVHAGLSEPARILERGHK